MYTTFGSYFLVLMNSSHENNTARNKAVQTPFSPFEYIARSGVAGSYGNCICDGARNHSTEESQCRFPQQLPRLVIPPAVGRVPVSPHSSSFSGSAGFEAKLLSAISFTTVLGVQ